MRNSEGARVWCKWHLKTRQGIRNLLPAQAAALAGTDPDHAQRDLFKAIAEANYPRWNVFVQIMTEAEAAQYRINPFDLTKVWPHKDYPRIPVGVLELNRNPVNYHAEVEQAAFSPANVVPGLGFSPDKMLQGRLFAYHDAQLYRVGTNHQYLPVNAPRCPVRHQQRDGAMSFNGNFGSAPNYDPSTIASAPTQNPAYREPAVPLSGEAADRYDHRVDEDYYSQAGALYRLIPAAEKDRLTTNIARAMHGIAQHIIERQLQHFGKADADYGRQVAEKLRAVR
jgi:catalase